MDGEVFVDPVVWLFALPEPSRAQAQSPILTPAEITAIRESSAAQENLKKAVELMSGFCQRKRSLADALPTPERRSNSIWPLSRLRLRARQIASSIEMRHAYCATGERDG